MVRTAASVLGWDTVSFPRTLETCLLMRSSPVPRSRSSHWRASSSPPPQACGQLQKKQFVAAVLLGLNQKALHLLPGQHLHLPPPFPRQLAALGGVHGDQALLYCLGQRRPAGDVAAPDRAFGQSRTVEVRSIQPPAVLELVVKLLEVCLCQLIQGDLSQGRDDVPVDPQLILLLGAGPESGHRAGLIPAIQPRPEGHAGLDVLGLLRRAALLPQGFQLPQALPFRFGQAVSGPGIAPLIVAHHAPPLPAAVLSQVDAAAAGLSPLCHGVSSFPKMSVMKVSIT